MKAGTWTVWLLRLGFGVLLLAAALPKIAQPLLFAEAVANYRVLGEPLSRWAAVWVPWLELLAGLSLISGLWLEAGVTVNAGLMTAFLVLVVQARLRGLDIGCGCFDVQGEDPITWLKIMENLAFAAGSLLLARLCFRPSGSGFPNVNTDHQ